MKTFSYGIFFFYYDGTEQHRSGKGELKKPPKYDATKNIVAFNSFDEDVDVSTEVSDKKRQWQKFVNIDNDIANFLLEKTKYSEELKGLLFRLGAELQILKSGFIKIKKVDGNTIPNWEERCEKTINVFCSCFDKKDFPLDDEIRDSIPEALSTLQKDLSSTEGACWLDKPKQNLILVSPKDGFSNAEKEVKQFFEKVRRFAKRNFEIEESIYELVRKDLPTLKEALKHCNITLNKKTLVVVCLRNEVDNVNEKVESFLQRLQGEKIDGNVRCVVLCCVVLCCGCVVLCCVVLRCVVLRCVVLCCIALRCVVLCCVVSCRVVSCCVVLCCVVLCCVVLCCVVLCCVVLCCVVLRCGCVMLCCVV